MPRRQKFAPEFSTRPTFLLLYHRLVKQPFARFRYTSNPLPPKKKMDKHTGNEEGSHWTTTCCELPSSTNGTRIGFDVLARTRPTGPLNFFDRTPNLRA